MNIHQIQQKIDGKVFSYQEIVDAIPIANKNLFKLEKLLGEQYDKNVWDNLTKDTYIFKTTYKLSKDILSSNGTYYRHLLDQQLEILLWIMN